MKKFLQFAGLISAALALTAFIFMMAGNGLVYKASESTTYTVGGIRAIFGGEEQGLLTTVQIKPAVTALIAWILVLVALLILIAGVVLPLLKVNALEKFAGVLNLIAVGALVVAGLLLFFTKGAFNNANADVIGGNKVTYYDDYNLSFAFVMAAILNVAAGVIAVMPAVVNFLGGKK